MISLRIYRLSNALFRRGWKRCSRGIDRVNYLVTNCWIPGSASIGADCRIAYGGIAVVIHSDAIIGRRCLIGQGITIGAREPSAGAERRKPPQIGDDVYIAAGSRIIGEVQIGNQVVIGANAVVNRDVANNAVVAGIPARVIGRTATDYSPFM